LAFGIEIDKDVVRRVLSVHYRPESDSGGPSWLTFLGQTKDSLWSCDLFRCESATLRTHWVLVVMDQFTRRIIGFGVHGGIVDGVALCHMFQRAIRGHSLPKYLSSDHDPLYRFHQWQANLRVLEVAEVKTVPFVPLSHPFVERLIGTIRREYLDHTLFWTTADLETKLFDFQHYYNGHRTHAGLDGRVPESAVNGPTSIGLDSYRWRRHCRGLYQTPIAASSYQFAMHMFPDLITAPGSLRPFEMPPQELERTLAVNRVGTVEEFDFGPVGQIHSCGIEPARLGELVCDPFIWRDAVMVTALHHERPGSHQVPEIRVIDDVSEIKFDHVVLDRQ
jgi:hypothetical protein